MSERRVDARGMACPQPVLLARREILETGAERIRVTVDDEACRENVERMGASLGYDSTVERRAGEIDVLLTRRAGAAPEPGRGPFPAAGAPSGGPVVVLVASSLLGTGDEELGRILMRSFVKTARDAEPLPATMIFLNSGVRLTTEGSDLLEDLRALEERGTELLSCGTCLDYYKVKDRLRAGRATNMLEIASLLLGAGHVVRL